MSNALVPNIHRVLALVLFGVLSLRVAHAQTVVTNFALGFEASEGFTTGPGWVGQGSWEGFVLDDLGANWLPSGPEGNGILDGVFPTTGQQAYIGLTPLPSLYGPLQMYREFAPGTLPASVSAVKFSALMQIVDSTSTNYDHFFIQVGDTNGTSLADFWFSNRSLRIYSWDPAITNYTWTSNSFNNALSYQLSITFNVTNNTWGATLGAATLVANRPIPAWSTNIGVIFTAWDQQDYALPGDNYLVLDNLLVTTETYAAPPPAAPTLSVLSSAPDVSTTLRLTGQNGYKFAIETAPSLAAPLNWNPLTTNTVSGGYFDYPDTATVGVRTKVYRARWVP